MRRITIVLLLLLVVSCGPKYAASKSVHPEPPQPMADMALRQSPMAGEAIMGGFAGERREMAGKGVVFAGLPQAEELADESAPTPSPSYPEEAASNAASDPFAPAAAPVHADRYLIKNAQVNIEVEDLPACQLALTQAIGALGGYISDMQEMSAPYGRRSFSMQVRVPSERFDEAMTRIQPMGQILSRSITTQDVTEEFLDTDARVRNLKKTEERLLDHLNRAVEVNGILTLEKELNRVREEVERHEGRLRFLQHRVAFSTITLTVQEKPKAGPVAPPTSFSTASVASEAMRDVVRLLREIWTAAIWIGVWSVIWIPLAIVATGVIWLIMRTAPHWLKTEPHKPETHDDAKPSGDPEN